MAGLFGTDGVRGLANQELTPELALKLGKAVGSILRVPGKTATMIVGRDSRISGTMLEGALTAGLCSAGVDVDLAGVMPTPAVAFLVKELGCCAGAVISASHNPAPDNGIKFFNQQGYKLADELEETIERLIDQDLQGITLPSGGDLGRSALLTNSAERYARFVKSTLDCDLRGLKVVLDCANGAACRIGPELIREMGAQVISLNDLPDGTNINADCGSTHPAALQEAVVKYGASLGLAFDGDADRVIAVDENGQLVDGDKILVICGLALQQTGELNDKIVVTVMSNLGLRQAFEKAGITVYETPVGDRYVLEKMIETGAILGGEQSGHIIFGKHATTGDGILTGLQLMGVMKQSGQGLSELARQMTTLPQLLINVKVRQKQGWEANPRIMAAIAEAEETLAGSGRLLVRASGTEALIRVMAEGPDNSALTQVADKVARIVETELA